MAPNRLIIRERLLFCAFCSSSFFVVLLFSSSSLFLGRGQITSSQNNFSSFLGGIVGRHVWCAGVKAQPENLDGPYASYTTRAFPARCLAGPDYQCLMGTHACVIVPSTVFFFAVAPNIHPVSKESIADDRVPCFNYCSIKNSFFCCCCYCCCYCC